MPRITLADLQVHEVELPGGHLYTVIPATRSVVRKMSALDTRLEQLLTGDGDLTDEQLDQLVDIYADMLNLRLESLDGAPRPATVVKRLWKGDQVSVPQLEQLLAGVAGTDRPT